MLGMARPKNFMPVHGEAVHLRAHAELAQQMGVPANRIFILDNGDTLEMRNGKVTRGKTVESGVVYDLSGRRVQHADKGFYIVDGRKVLK